MFIQLVIFLAIIERAFALPTAQQLEIAIAPTFTSNAVFQRDADVTIWGWTSHPQIPVTVRLNNKQLGNAQVLEKDAECGNRQKWSFLIKKTDFSSTGPHTLTISSASSSVSATNIMLGEVIICDGQSNMRWPIKHTVHSEQSAVSPDSSIRFMEMYEYRGSGDNPGSLCYMNKFSWTTTTSNNLPDRSSVCYNAAMQLKARFGVPVGAIVTAVSGASVSCLLPGGNCFMRNTANLKGLTVRGIAYYQGEADSRPSRVAEYENRLRLLIKTYREHFNYVVEARRLPFIVVQLAGVFPGMSDRESYLEVMKIQERVAATTRSVFRVKASDHSKNLVDIHPQNGKAGIGKKIGNFLADFTVKPKATERKRRQYSRD